MRFGAVALCVVTLLIRGTTAIAAQTPAPDAVATLLHNLEATMNAHDRAAFAAFFDVQQATIVQGYLADLFIPGVTHSIIRERDRTPLEAVPDGQGYRVVVEFFVETTGRAKILTASLDLKRPADGDIDSWRIIAAEGLTSVEGLYKLRLRGAVQYAAHNLDIKAEDFVLSLSDASVFLVECDDGITGLVVVGRGEMRFTPAPAAERGQLKLFAGTETLATPIDAAFIRLNPEDYQKRIDTAALTGMPVDPRALRRAQDVFDEESPKSFNVDLKEFSRDNWYLVPPSDDFLAEVDTRRFGTLTYSKANANAEDVTLFQRDKRKTIALYASKGKLAVRGRFFSEDFLRDYDVSDYNIEAGLNPTRQFVQGRARLSIRTRASLATLQLRLAESLVVSNVTSVEFGRLLYLRLRGQNMVIVNLPRLLPADTDITLVVTYAGRVEPQTLETESIQPAQDSSDTFNIPTEPNYMLSNRSFWYPQNPVPDYATATLRLSVPDGFTCIASGTPVSADNVVSLRDIQTLSEAARVFTFRADQPLRYLSFIISRFNDAADRTIVLGDNASDPSTPRVDFHLQANPRQMGRARAVSKPAEDIVRFYTSVMGDAPFPSITVALIESLLPGGHSPGFMVVVNEPLPTAENVASWRSDPAWFDGFPEFFLAHELAHQWWGQAVGWKNYHEQWISEGFAQYFAALYAQKTRGEKTFTDMLRQFRRWSLSDSDQGPVHLGYRLGHIKSEPRVYRAIVYNKGALVLHMLRRLVGDQAFFAGLRRFYEERKFQKAGTDDLQRAFETETGRKLDRFFERWIYNTEVPHVDYRTTIGRGNVTITFDQTSDLVFDLPVTVTVSYADGRTKESVVALTEKHVEAVIETDGAVRQVQINRDNGALAEFDQR
ncbi:MAG TPA: M1 family aminopeptidase [Vicinamibacterales bacterium]|nr:M1 family aminopeptidase [Vicinamibacterales bacterium]